MGNFFDDLKSVDQRVKTVLTDDESCRDCDFSLISKIWAQDVEAYCGEDHDILLLMAQKKLTHPESITRCRRKLQEKFPKLRGSLWLARHKLGKQVQCEINQLTLFNI